MTNIDATVNWRSCTDQNVSSVCSSEFRVSRVANFELRDFRFDDFQYFRFLRTTCSVLPFVYNTVSDIALIISIVVNLVELQSEQIIVSIVNHKSKVLCIGYMWTLSSHSFSL
ncbi:unnamed protein product [Albugo candida]|uniref:Uncharacterized protein n=1 Tax=Albugo candida TaxID=65357 RepID=A0A024GL35_9STRA|nr:unnamed protein product [Albugo candida]|eukprot:CCI47463.1 unnamed protein product [Albugo candida]